MVEESPLLCLKWNYFQENFTTQFAHLKSGEDFVDVTFSCEGKLLRAHRVVLSASSPYLTALFKENPCKHPVIILDEIPFLHLEWLLTFIYTGAVSVAEADLPALLESANVLQIRGLSEDFKPAPQTVPPAPKRSRPSLDVPELTTTPVVRRPAEVNGGRRHSRSASFDTKPELSTLISTEDDKAEVLESEVNEPLQSLQRIDADYGLNIGPPAAIAERIPPPSAQLMTGTVSHPPHQPDWATMLSSQAHDDQSADTKRRHSLDPRPCPICKRHYSNLSNLRQHLRLIHNPRLVTCHLCSKTFKTELYLRRHIAGFHLEYASTSSVDQNYKQAITGTQ